MFTKNGLTMADISTHRTELMGFAILWVFVFHSSISFPDVIYFYPLQIIKFLGFAGVDIFLFLSGMGLMMSRLKKKTPLKTFYAKRFQRIAPSYWLVTLIYMVLASLTFKDITIDYVFLKMTTIWFWLGNGLYLWYIPAIIFFYVTFPFWADAFQRCTHKVRFLVLTILISLPFSYVLSLGISDFYMILTSRIPIFFIGAFVGYWMHQNPDAKIRLPIFVHLGICSAFLGIVVVAKILIPENQLEGSGLLWYPLAATTYSMLCCLTYLFTKLAQWDHKPILKQIRGLFLLCGTLSLEIYLVHEHLIFRIGPMIWEKLGLSHPVFTTGRILEYGLYLIMSILAAIALHFIIEKFMSVIGKNQNKAKA